MLQSAVQIALFVFLCVATASLLTFIGAVILFLIDSRKASRQLKQHKQQPFGGNRYCTKRLGWKPNVI